ncbi:RNA-directed RNA polymerase [Caenorhabditis elegans]|nr:RNA-directed RNA polymerase [Caenorhabditis elegans]CCD31066.1 RNA-directed RNA polymerase [Caenorhabditis elegans]|eukprot:NP_001250556.1 RNA-dependent RNA polymerase Family [Caenorhabditis elegans]
MHDYLSDLNVYVPYQRPNIVLHGSDFWLRTLDCHTEIPLAAIYFGNIQGGTYFNHWQVSFSRENISSRDMLHKIHAEFEFDKTDMITVQFQCFEEKKQKFEDSRKQKVRVNYQLTIRRDSIRRIIVDPRVEGCNTCVHFEVNCPPLIRKGYIDNDKSSFHKPFYERQKRFDCDWRNGNVNHGNPQDAAIADSPFFTIEFHKEISTKEMYRVLSRLRSRTKVLIEFANLPSIDVPMGSHYPYNRWNLKKSPTDSNAPIFREFLKEIFPPKYEIVDDKLIDVNEERKFSITYLIECLLSRGAIVKDQLLLNEQHWKNFLEIIIWYYRNDNQLCEAALEDLVHLIDGRKRIGSILKCLDKICQKREVMKLVNGLTEKESIEGYQRVRKVIFTPTRVIYIAPETIMGNRVLRKFDKDGTRVLRVTFRDDNNKKMRSNVTGKLLDRTANKYLEHGVRIANREYGFLGCSNSQMRDNGAYFMMRFTDKQLDRFYKCNPTASNINFKPKIDEVRFQLGRFSEIENVPKLMARLGQCFTQSRLTGVGLGRDDYCSTYDLTGGRATNGSEYTFSDGVGMMSYQFAQEVSQAMQFGKAVPSCFQIRFRGNKGVIAIEPFLDEIRKWALVNGVTSMKMAKCLFRPSQIKFQAKAISGDQIEMVKFSSAVLVALNKPFINILDQVSEMQSLDCHKRITSRIEELMDRQILSFAKQMNEETFCRNKLKEFPRRIDIDNLRTMWGFTLSSEPFFRSLIKASIKFSITKQLCKEQIQIPSELGRSMLGVVDETGRLQYGQIFVQYTKNYKKKLPPRDSNNKVHGSEIVTGTVLLTKNPCIVPGDVRIFEAVDIPELHHMCDVVVFPQHGPRPHPDEMAGSDLDGDEYSVIWDQELLLERNEEPFDFAVEKIKVPYDREKLDVLMREFYVTYLKLDSVGQISNSHLHNSDQYGLNSRVCMDLAKKNCQAVDFTKSGQPPDPLETKWRADPVTFEVIPPENPERIPDFHMGNERSPMYVSPRLCGKLFREFQAIDNVIKISEERDEQYNIELDETIFVTGFERYMESAQKQLSSYNGQLRSIMENYGIRSEGEIMSGCIVEMRNRISDKDQDDMSFYNTNQMIETKMTSLVCKFRETFFEEFGGFTVKCTLLPNAYDNGNCLNYRCEDPDQEVRKKAVAWYRACYECAQSTREVRKLSFAWIAYDVIAKVKETNVLNNERMQIGGANPMYTFLEEHRKQYLIDHDADFKNFCELDHLITGEKSKEAISILKIYLEMIPGLDSVFFMLMRWGESLRLFDGKPIKIYHFFLMFILFATRQLASADGNAEPFFKIIEKEEYEKQKRDSSRGNIDPLTEKKRSDMMVKFFQFMGCRKFRKMSTLSFCPLNFSSIFMRGEWRIFHESALKTYYNILFNLRFEELPVSSDPTITAETMDRECEPFVIELPENINVNDLINNMKKHTNVSTVKMRRQEKNPINDKAKPKTTVRYIVSVSGTLESIQMLKKLSAVTIPIKSHWEGEEVSQQMASLCYQKVMNGEF